MGYLWQAFSMGYAPAVEGEEALRRWRDDPPERCVLCLPDEGLLFRVTGVPGDAALNRLGYAVLADEDLRRTLALTDKKDKGPYYMER